jgi:putative DNA primase/helicase
VSNGNGHLVVGHLSGIEQLEQVENEKATRPGLTKKLADAIQHKHHFALGADARLYVYHAGVYRPTGEQIIRREVKSTLLTWDKSSSWSRKRRDEVVAFITDDAKNLWERPPVKSINVLNGLLNVKTKELKPHSAAYLTDVQLPVLYDPDAKCPTWEKFVADWFPEDAFDLAWEIPALLMIPFTSLQKAVLLHGDGGNGKTRYLTGIRSFLGTRNVSGLSLQKIESDRFAASRLVGKLANICADLPTTALQSTSTFKAIVEGNETIHGERKFKDSFDFVPFARLLFASNPYPRSNDASKAFFDRFFVIPFSRQFRGRTGEIPRHVIDRELSRPAELSGLLNKALDALPGLLERNGFTASKTTTEAWDDFRKTTDPLAGWLDANTVLHSEAIVVRETLRLKYNNYLCSMDKPPVSATAFKPAVEALRESIIDTQRTVAGKMERVWVGIGLKYD